jgi:phage-related tail fiber protein
MKKVILAVVIVLVCVLWINAQDAITIIQNGNVGINNELPAEKLDVKGNIKTNGELKAELKLTDATSQKILRDILKHLNPVGTIQAYGGTKDPDGYMICDGRSLSRETYADLFAVIGTSYGAPDSTRFNIPDMRGEFLRGADNGAGVDTDARQASKSGGNTSGVGSKQDSANKSHNHSEDSAGWHGHEYTAYSFSGDNFGVPHELWDGYYEIWIYRYMYGLSGASGYTAGTGGEGSHSHYIYPSGDVESRPKNVAVNFIIKL